MNGLGITRGRGALALALLALPLGAQGATLPTASPPGSAPSPAQAVQADGTAEPPAQSIAPWGGSPREGLSRLVELEENGEREGALLLAERLLATDFEDAALTPSELERTRAELHYAAGVIRSRAEQAQAAVEANLAARALAGPGELRLDATYNAGVAYLEEGERQRLQIPEIAQAAQQAAGANPLGAPVSGAVPGMTAGALGAPGPAAEEGPKPIELARAAYESARTQLVERLRADWRDEDTRANVELIQRRLRELDEIEEEREKQEQEQQDQEQQDQDQEDQEQEDQEEQDQEKSEDEQQESEPSENEEESESEQEPSEEEGEEEPDTQDPSERDENESEGEQEQPDPAEPEDPREEEEEAQPASEQQAEQHLSREEAQRLLDRLAEIEQSAEKLKALLRQKERVPVKRDW